ncbi:uncharacterized protein LOC123290881 isoform X2 [Chrysoperla carnea]|nr:uncharacterized protein LOC123290881 isoform X2 [Chrysoperla carnea]
MDCLQPLRCPSTTPGPFHYLINEQAKSLVALQELQHEVGALLEFRDLVIETFPNLRNKMAAVSSSSPVTMTGTNHHHQVSNIPIPRRDWEPGIRVRRRIQHKENDNSPSRSRSNSHSSKHQPKSNTETTSVVQDSGFSTETSSSKETHSASSTTGLKDQQTLTSTPAMEECEDELWNLLDVIQRKGTKLRDEVEALQGALCNRNDANLARNDESGTDFHQQILLGNTPQDVINLRRERDVLLEKLADMESENLAGRVQASRLRADLESLLATKIELEEQLRAAISQKTELNSRIHDLHMQFVKTTTPSTSPDSQMLSTSVGGGNYKVSRSVEKPTRRRRTLSNRNISNTGAMLIDDSNFNSKELLVTNFPITTSSSPTSSVNVSGIVPIITTSSPFGTTSAVQSSLTSCSTPSPSGHGGPGGLIVSTTSTPVDCEHNIGAADRLNNVLFGQSDELPKVRVPDSQKIAAILDEHDPLVLQKSLLTVTVHNQALKQRLELADKLKTELIENLSKAREQHEDFKFQLEEKDIELEGTRARVRLLEQLRFQFQKTASSSYDDQNHLDSTNIDESPPTRRIDQLSTPSMKAMIPIPLADETHIQNNSSTESAHDQKASTGGTGGDITPRRIKPSRIPLLGTSPQQRSCTKSVSSLTRPGSAQSGSSLSGSKSATSIPTPRGTKTPRDSLTGRLRSNDSLSKLRETSNQQLITTPIVTTPGRSASVCNKRDGVNRLRRVNSNATRNGGTTALHDANDGGNTKMIRDEENMSSLYNENTTLSDPLYSDSLDENDGNEEDNATTTTGPDSISEKSHPIFQTANNFLWNNLSKTSEYFDSINSADCFSSESLQRCREGLAECDSLEEKPDIKNIHV